jgi:UDP-2,3-diacylglucosamine pyrophosphatase LpxH
MMKAHLDEALGRDAAILSCGDTFDVMNGKYDKRASKAACRPEHQVDNYLDALVQTGADWFAPYARNHVMFGVGNHESVIKVKWETDLIERFIGLLNARSGVTVYNGSFSGWVRFAFTTRAGTRGDAVKHSVSLHYDHGYGGAAPVTEDMIQHQRRSVYLPDADIVISGHTHGAFVSERARVRLNKAGQVVQDIQTHIKLSSYKDDYGKGTGGWASEKGLPPKPLGAWWLRFFWSGRHKAVIYEVIRAK